MKTITEFAHRKKMQEKIVMVTCYDYTMARIISQTDIDCVLIGDSGGMLMLGKKDTTQTTLKEMQWMTKAVAKGTENKVIVADMPFMSYRQSIATTVRAVSRLIQAGAHAVKLEGAAGNIDTIAHIVESGVPVMGHLGLTPQFVHAFGGFKVQGKTAEAAQQLIADAKALAQAGCFALVLECIPGHIAQSITEQIDIPTIGIGAGCATDGQVLVAHDLLGLQTDFKPRFVKYYASGAELFIDAINQYTFEVNNGIFPDQRHTYSEQ